MRIRTEQTDHTAQEYGGSFRRLYPWNGVVTPPWGAAMMSLEPGGVSIPHDHDEEETFIFISGEGVITVDKEEGAVSKGDVVYLPRFSRHFVKNTSATELLQFLCIWWGAPSSEKIETQDTGVPIAS
jgi:mannose-6-phosphate isomerase-like protein (cupin superfamily)